MRESPSLVPNCPRASPSRSVIHSRRLPARRIRGIEHDFPAPNALGRRASSTELRFSSSASKEPMTARRCRAPRQRDRSTSIEPRARLGRHRRHPTHRQFRHAESLSGRMGHCFQTDRIQRGAKSAAKRDGRSTSPRSFERRISSTGPTNGCRPVSNSDRWNPTHTHPLMEMRIPRNRSAPAVAGVPTNTPLLVTPSRACGAGQPEVRDDRLAILVEQDIRRFQIAVNDTCLMRRPAPSDRLTGRTASAVSAVAPV